MISEPLSSVRALQDAEGACAAKTPGTATASGAQGEICWDATYLYVCTATNTWRRVALTTW